MFLKVLLIILVLVYAFWGLLNGYYVLPSRYFVQPSQINNTLNVYLIFYAHLAFVSFLVFSILKSRKGTRYAAHFNIAANVSVIAAIGLFIFEAFV